MKVLLHDNQLCERGTTNSVITYARALQNVGHEVAIGYRRDHPGNVDEVVRKVEAEFALMPYSESSELTRASRSFDATYFQKSGNKDGLSATSPRVIVHAVFQEFQPHGTSYYYISEWLARRVKQRIFSPRSARDVAWSARAITRGLRGLVDGTANAFDFDSVPYMCDLPVPTEDMRRALDIPEDAFVILRYGGFSTFDIPWVPEVLRSLLEQMPHLYFVGVNTPTILNHPRALFLPRTVSEQAKSNLLGSADLFLTARQSGESFGLAHVEALQVGLPVLAYGGGWDRNQVEMLKPIDGLYMSEQELRTKIELHLAGSNRSNNAYRRIGDEYRPAAVTPKLEAALFNS